MYIEGGEGEEVGLDTICSAHLEVRSNDQKEVNL